MSGKFIGSMPLAMFGLVAAGILVAFAASVMLPSEGVSAAYGFVDNGKTISMSEGSVFKIILDENPTTGYSWNESLTAGLKATNDEYVASDSGLMGAGGTHEWVIQATGKGEQRFTAVYQRPWEPAAGNETTFTLTIVVK